VTIAAGFCVKDGILICADTEHGAAGVSIIHESKIILTPDMKTGKAMFSYSGNTQLARAAIQNCIDRIYYAKKQSIVSPAQMANVIGDCVNESYRTHVSQAPDPSSDSVYQLIFATWCPNCRPMLFTTWHGAKFHFDRYEFIGSGFHIGQFIVGPLFRNNMDVSDAHAIASYAVARAKQAAEGVGGLTNTSILRNDGTFEHLSWVVGKQSEDVIAWVDDSFRKLFWSLISAPDDEFGKAIDSFHVAMRHARDIGNYSDERRANPRPAFFSFGSLNPSTLSVLGPAIYDPSSPLPSQE